MEATDAPGEWGRQRTVAQELPAAAEGIQNEMYRDGEDLGTGAGADSEAFVGYWYQEAPELEQAEKMAEPAADYDGVTEVPCGPDMQEVRTKSKGVD